MTEANRHPDPHELAALYVCGALTSDEAAAVERAAATDPQLALALREAAPLAADLLTLVPALKPAPHTRDALLARVTAQPINGVARRSAEPTATGADRAEVSPAPDRAERPDAFGASAPGAASPSADSAPAPKTPQVWKQWDSTSAGGALFTLRSDATPWEPTGIEGIEIRRLFVDRQRNQTTMLIRMAAGRSYPRHVHGGAEECLVLEGDLRVGDNVLHAGDYQRAPEGSLHGVQATDGGCVLLIVSSLTDELV